MKLICLNNTATSPKKLQPFYANEFSLSIGAATHRVISAGKGDSKDTFGTWTRKAKTRRLYGSDKNYQ
jgi:hypothetical protein